jgi:hypothetical protein
MPRNWGRIQWKKEFLAMRTVIQWICRGLAIIAALMATAQPVLGSFSFFLSSDPVAYETLHLIVGGLLYNAVLLLALLVGFARFRRRWILLGICILQYALTHAQLRLGLGSNDDATLLAYHIPVGVLIFFLSYLTAALTFGLRLESSES